MDRLPRYYDDLEPGDFPYQRILCRALQDSLCPLEEDGVNPLTVRLLAARTATLGLDRTLAGAAQSHWRSSPGQPPDAWPGAASVPPASAFPIMEAQLALFQFFTAFCGALDRLAWEVSMLFGLRQGPAAIGWRDLVSGCANRRARWCAPLRDGSPAVASWLTGLHASALSTSFAYLDSLHDPGHIPAMPQEITDAHRSWTLMVGPANAAGPQPLDRDVLQLCRVLLHDGLAFINGTYYLLLRRCDDHGPPPW